MQPGLNSLNKSLRDEVELFKRSITLHLVVIIKELPSRLQLIRPNPLQSPLPLSSSYIESLNFCSSSLITCPPAPGSLLSYTPVFSRLSLAFSCLLCFLLNHFLFSSQSFAILLHFPILSASLPSPPSPSSLSQYPHGHATNHITI